jgi:tetratricopeptide (TPR) repeat protein
MRLVQRLRSHAGPRLPDSSGRLPRAPQPRRSSRLQQIPLSELSGELLGRIAEGAFDSQGTVGLGCRLQAALASALDVRTNRMSRQWYQDFGVLPLQVGSDLLRLDGATVVDVGCGSVNPYGVLFLFLMLGARRGIAIDLDPIQDRERAVKALADCAAMMLLDPRGLVGDYPIDRARMLEHIASFDLARLRAGDATGLDDARLLYRQEAVGRLSLEDGEADLVLSNSFLEHVADADECIADLARITRVDGLGIHRIDGADHRRYMEPDRDPLDFLTETSSAGMVGGCNRIRPLDFVPLFERHGFEIMLVTPSEVIEIDPGRSGAFVEPFRSRPREVLGVIGAQFVVQRKRGRARGTGVSSVALAAGWRRPPTATYVNTAATLMRQQRYVEALDLLEQITPDDPEYARGAALSGRIRHASGDHEGAERDLACAIALPTPRPEAFLYRAWLRLEQGRSAEGFADALQVRRLLPPHHLLETQACGVLALLHAREGRHTEAMALLDRLLQHQPMEALIHLWRGWAFHIAGEPEQAYTAAEAALACDPDLGEIRRLMEALKAPGGHPPREGTPGA